MCASLHELLCMLVNPCLHMGIGRSLNFLLPDVWQMNLGKVHFSHRHGGFSTQVLSSLWLWYVPGRSESRSKLLSPLQGSEREEKKGVLVFPLFPSRAPTVTYRSTNWFFHYLLIALTQGLLEDILDSNSTRGCMCMQTHLFIFYPNRNRSLQTFTAENTVKFTCRIWACWQQYKP